MAKRHPQNEPHEAEALVAPTTLFLPRWTKRVSLGSGGRDPLGLSRVTSFLTNELMKGIITITPSARYHAVYCWIMWHIEEHEEIETAGDYCAAFQRRETAFAVATMRDRDRRPGFTPLGVERVRPKLEDDPEVIDLDFPVLSGETGGFSQNYRGSMREFGLWYRPEGVQDRVTDGLAREFAATVDEAVSSTPYIQNERWRAERAKGVPLADLDASAEAMSLDALRRPDHDRERDLILDMLFALDDLSNPDGVANDDHTRRRRLSLGWILWTIDAYEKAGAFCDAEQLDAYLLFAPAYFGVLRRDEGACDPIRAPTELEDNLAFWRHFCAQQYLTFALEGVLASLLNVASAAGEEGASIPEIRELLLGEAFLAFLNDRFGADAASPRSVLASQGVISVPTEHHPASAGQARPIGHELSEDALCESNLGAEQQLAQALALLAVLYARWRALPVDGPTRAVDRNAGRDPWVGNSLQGLDAWLAPGSTWDVVVDDLLNASVSRHQRVLYEKGDLTKCWLDVADGRLRYIRSLRPSFRSSRFPMAISILRDLGVVQAGVEQTLRELEDEEQDEEERPRPLTLTALGKRTLTRVMEVW